MKTLSKMPWVGQEIVNVAGVDFLTRAAGSERLACCQLCAALVPNGPGSMDKHANWHIDSGDLERG